MNKYEDPRLAHKDIPGNPSTAKSSKFKLNRRIFDEPLRCLSEEQWSFWKHNGYVVIESAVDRKQAQATADFLWEFEEKDPEDPGTWYSRQPTDMQMKELVGTGMVEVYNHQSLWNNRQHPKVYDAFVDIWGLEDLWVTIDRANLNFPMRPGYQYKGFIHWDYDPDTKPENVQGVLALSDQTDLEMGGFQCIPWLFRNYDEWKKTQPANRDKYRVDVSMLEDKLVKVPLRQGDLLIFHSQTPHGIRPNRTKDKVRIAQYISMMPAQPENVELLEWRIRSWQDRVAPVGYAFPGDPRNWEQTKYSQAKLSELGKKLLGLKNYSCR